MNDQTKFDDPLRGVVAHCHRILLTGAAGNLGTVMRERLTRYADIVRVSDIANLGAEREGEEIVQCDLADGRAVDALVDGVDVIVHFGGVSVERPFEQILPANILGTFNIYEAARRRGIRRIVFASSNHVTGCYEQSEGIDATVRPRPDGYYGVSKAFGENLAQLYFDRYGIETVSLRIGSSFPEAKDRRMLVTWLGYDDLEQLLCRAMFVADVNHTIVYGVSNNRDRWWDNRAAQHLGYSPVESSEQFRARVESLPPLAEGDPAVRFQGGSFLAVGPFGD
ncbi:NAD-dependent dehydratase [Burkholderia sp. Nafp2/4-1b]|uniref:NAD-dependent epimerase/dehydratase family protein n=1 Tax=Burkholderia sp. Nafp2/4-1b TaxID=2116686 RepID=UPI000EF934C1|nr:NAD(P)-dependent oxidoreductase [Burkholderia sp. Nafp2/4-1b]RKU00075.1 NAD-dependent dehydratase [Burkholderia sp. Nafp2/4-1b]